MYPQIVVRHGQDAESRLAAALSRCPPSMWQPAVPQLIAQLQQHHRTTEPSPTPRTSSSSIPPSPATLASAAVRRLLLSRLLAVAEASSFSVLYPCIVQARIAEASETELCAEMQVGIS